MLTHLVSLYMTTTTLHPDLSYDWCTEQKPVDADPDGQRPSVAGCKHVRLMNNAVTASRNVQSCS